MIVVVSSNAAERGAFAALCDSRGWTNAECDSVRATKKLLQQLRPHVAIVRHKLSDGYSDEVLAAFTSSRLLPAVRVIVLLDAGAASALAARQVALGADSVQRDPVRTDVLAEYLHRYLLKPGGPARTASRAAGRKSFRFAHALIHPVERTLIHQGRQALLTPREVQLAELLFESQGEIVTYATLYSEILASKFRGDTSNMRVLLGKLAASLRSVGLVFRDFVEVIPKTGYRYTSPRKPSRQLKSARSHSRSTAA